VTKNSSHPYTLAYFLNNPLGFYKKNFKKVRPLNMYWFARKFYAKVIATQLKKSKANQAKVKILELGCGFGDLLALLTKHNQFELFGVDISADAIKVAKKRAAGASFAIANALDIPKTFPRASFDFVVAIHLIEHIKYPEKLIAEIKALLTPEGKLLVVTPNRDSQLAKLKGSRWEGLKDKTHISLMGKEKLKMLLESQRLKIVKEFTDGPWDPPYLSHLPKWFQASLFKFLCALNILSNGNFLPADFGESIGIIAQKVNGDKEQDKI